MVRRLIKFLALLVVIAIVAVPVTALLMDDETFSGLLDELSVPAENADTLLNKKQSIGMTLGEYVGDAFGGLEGIYFAIMGPSEPKKPMNKTMAGSKQVIIDLPPPPPSTPSVNETVFTPSPPPQITAPKKQPAISPAPVIPPTVTPPANSRQDPMTNDQDPRPRSTIQGSKVQCNDQSLNIQRKTQ